MTNRPSTRAGVLIVVLWAVVILSIILMNFAFMTKTHLRIASNYMHTNRLHNIAAAGVECAINELQLDNENGVDYLQELWAANPNYLDYEFGGGTFTLERNSLDDPDNPVYGIEDEASKLNLLFASRDQILKLPGMDEILADALTDWQDADDMPMLGGAENEFYETLPHPYSCKNGKLSTIHELLLIRGFDELTFYGEDTNGNGMLDTNEDDGDATDPPDNQDGFLDRGLLPFVTVYSADRNITPEGEDCVDINSANESQLKSTIPDLTDEEARAIVAWRGRSKFQNLGDLLKVTEANNDNSNNNNNNPQGRGGTSNNSQNNQNTSNSGNKVFSTERLKQIISYCAIDNKKVVPGRININTAPFEVLSTGLDGIMAEAIVAQRANGTNYYENIADLLDVPGMTETLFSQISNFITVRSFQFKVRSVAKIADVKSRRTITAVLDRSEPRIKILYWNEY